MGDGFGEMISQDMGKVEAKGLHSPLGWCMGTVGVAKVECGAGFPFGVARKKIVCGLLESVLWRKAR